MGCLLFWSILEKIDQVFTEYCIFVLQDEYDDFVAALLDSQPGKHRALHDQVQQLSSRNTMNPETLDFEMKRLKGKEEEAQLMIEINER